MTLVKTKYDITLNEVSLIFENKELYRLKKYRLVPTAIAIKYYKQFMFEFGAMFNNQEIEQLIDKDIMRFKIKNRIQYILTPLAIGLLLPNNEYFRGIYKEMFGIDFVDGDVSRVNDEIKRLTGKYAEIKTVAKPINNSDKISFEQIVTWVEALLDRGIDRNMKLYQFKFQYDLAVRKAQEYENNKGK